MTLSHGAGLRLLIVALALLIALQMTIVGVGFFLRAKELGRPTRTPIVEQIVGAADLMDALAPAERDMALRAVNSPFVHFSLLDSFPRAAVERPALSAYRPVLAAYREALGERPLRVFIRRAGEEGRWSAYRVRPRGRRPAEFVIVIGLADGSALVVEPSPQYRRQLAMNFFALLSTIVGLVLLVALVYASFATSRPLARLAAGAEKFAADLSAPPFEEKGPEPVRNVARALNLMQADIRKLVSERTVTLAAVAHDFRTYLTRLRLRAEYIDDAAQRERTIADIEEMTGLIDDTLLFAKASEARAPLEPVDAAALAREVVAGLVETGADARFEGADGPILVRAHAPSLKRAVANLAGNAVKYGKAARVAARVEGGDAIIRVEDDGEGVAPEHLARLSEPFFRVESSRSRETGGAGLGLAIARMLVEASGGALALSNAPPGGLVAEIRLPRDQGGGGR